MEDDFKLTNNDESTKIKETLNNPNLTKEKFIQISNTLINALDIDIKLKSDPARSRKWQDKVLGEEKEQIMRL